MKLCIFFEGTGQGISGNITNVTRLYDAAEASEKQKLHLEAGPGTHFGAYVRGLIHGHDWWLVFRGARRWFEANCKESKATAEGVKVFVFGFSRGALIARHFVAWLEKLGVDVAYLGLWDTVDATLGLDVAENVPSNVRFARHAVARDETRRLYEYIPLKPPKTVKPHFGKVEELVFPGSHSDVGGLFEDNHVVADAALAWVAEGAVAAGMELKDRKILEMPPETAAVVLHDAHDEATNLWGMLGRVKRVLPGLPLHSLCRKIFTRK
jgi:hypothetical protein